jgi:hypothetical protein
VGHVESYFGPFRDSVSIGVRSVHGLCQTYHRQSYRVERPMVLLGDEAQVVAHFGLFGDTANFDAR